MELLNYLNDGASFQAQAVLAMLKDNIKGYGSKLGNNSIEITRATNGRESGYIASLYAGIDKQFNKQLNIFFSEDRNTDQITVVWFVRTFFSDANLYCKEYEEAYENRQREFFGYGQINSCASFIFEKFVKYHEDGGKL